MMTLRTLDNSRLHIADDIIYMPTSFPIGTLRYYVRWHCVQPITIALFSTGIIVTSARDIAVTPITMTELFNTDDDCFPI
jgi:hypothetical protein